MSETHVLACEDDMARQIASAAAGDRVVMGRLFEAARPSLLRAAEHALPAALRGKLGAADLVQDTFLEAQQDFRHFRGRSRAELLAWLRRTLHHNLVNAVRRYRTAAKRAVGREVAVDPWRLESVSAAPPPAARLEQSERRRQLEGALDRLPPDYREVVRCRGYDEQPFQDIARRLGRTSEAVRRVWIRAIDRLQTLLPRPED